MNEYFISELSELHNWIQELKLQLGKSQFPWKTLYPSCGETKVSLEKNRKLYFKLLRVYKRMWIRRENYYLNSNEKS